MSSPPSLSGIFSGMQQAKRPVPEMSDESASRNAKRLKTVTQACRDCRRNKAKCDGTRPKCGSCIHKGRDCGYEGEVGQSRQAAMKARLETLEKLFETLQNHPPGDAERLLQRIRSADGLATVLSISGDESTDAAPFSRGPLDPFSTSPSSSSASGRQYSRFFHPQNDSPSHGYLPRRPAASGSLSRLSYTPSTTSTGSKELSDASTLLVRLRLPNQALTTRAIDSFFESTGQLFHVFSRDQIASYLDEVYASASLTASLKKAVCCVTSVAAVGVQYKADDFDNGLEGTFYDVARHHFVDVLEDRPLESIKVCALLAMYNIMNKGTVSVAYVEVGLGMCRRHSINDKDYISPDWKSEEGPGYLTTWRCLIFFSTWLSSTLGYISNEDVPLTNVMPVAEAESDSSADIIDAVQVEMTKISILKADILRMHLASKDLTEAAIASVVADLQEWYHKLPPAMALATLGQSDLPNSVRRSIYYVHLLYLGAIMLLYRRIASQFNRSNGVDQQGNRRSKRFEQMMLNHAEQGVLAAKTSSRVLGLLLGQTGCFKRCWVVIFQSYTSGVVLLHCVAQKQVHNMDPSSWDEDLSQAKTCLNALDYCGTIDPVALEFHERLSIIFQNLTQHTTTPGNQRTSGSILGTEPSGASSLPPLSSSAAPFPHATGSPPPNHRGTRCYDPVSEPHPFAYLFHIPANGDPESVKLSVSLLEALSKPFDNPDNTTDTKGKKNDVDDERVFGTTQREQHHSGQSFPHDNTAPSNMDWDIRSARTYRWNPTELGFPDSTADSTMAAGARFLGSTAPNGWSTTI